MLASSYCAQVIRDSNGGSKKTGSEKDRDIVATLTRSDIITFVFEG